MGWGCSDVFVLISELPNVPPHEDKLKLGFTFSLSIREEIDECREKRICYVWGRLSVTTELEWMARGRPV